MSGIRMHRQKKEKMDIFSLPKLNAMFKFVLLVAVYNPGLSFEECTHLKTDTGVLHSENFPNKFPVPVTKSWCIDNPNKRTIVIYLNQVYLKTTDELLLYTTDGPVANGGKRGEISLDHDLGFYNRCVVISGKGVEIRFRVDEYKQHSQRRTWQYFRNVYGFNITYEILDGDNNENPCRPDKYGCVASCLFLGHCYASYDYSKHTCHCFEGFYGSICQYGPLCTPKGEYCHRKGKCRYIGPDDIVCTCEKGYSMASKCEKRNCTSITENPIFLQKTDDPEFLKNCVVSVQPGEMLHINCNESSRNDTITQFKWFKDGKYLDKNLAYRFVNITEKDGSSLLSLKATSYDSGVFECQLMQDTKNLTESRFVTVRVRKPLVALIQPTVSNFYDGGKIELGCTTNLNTKHSLDDTFKWYLDDLQMTHEKQTRIDAMIYDGSLLTTNVWKDAVFTCRVSVLLEKHPKLITAFAKSYVHFKNKNDTRPDCMEEIYRGIKWQRTIGGKFDLHCCPDTHKYCRVHVNRSCECIKETDRKEEMCYWLQPDYSKCTSKAMRNINKETELLRLGYQGIAPKTIFENINTFVFDMDEELLSGDIDLAADIFYNLLRHVYIYPTLVQQNAKIEIKAAFDLLTMLTSYYMQNTTLQEKQNLVLESRILKIVSVLVYNDFTTFFTGSMDPFITQSVIEEVSVLEINFPTMNDLFSEKLMHKYTNYTMSEVKIIYPEMDRNPNVNNVYINITFPHEGEKGDAKCLSWRLDGQASSGWSENGCKRLVLAYNGTVCRCILPGAFVALTKDKVVRVVTKVPVYPEHLQNHFLILTILGITAFVMVTVVLIFHIFQIVKWRSYPKDVIGLNSLACTLVIYLTLIFCMQQVLIQVPFLCGVAELIIYFFVLLCLTFEVMDMYSLWKRINTGPRILRPRMCRCSYPVTAWVISGLLAIPMIPTMIFDFKTEEYKTCQIMCQMGSNCINTLFFFIPFAFLFACFLIVLTVLYKTYRKEFTINENMQEFHQQHIVHVLMSVWKFVMLLLICLLKISFDNETEHLYAIASTMLLHSGSILLKKLYFSLCQRKQPPAPPESVKTTISTI